MMMMTATLIIVHRSEGRESSHISDTTTHSSGTNPCRVYVVGRNRESGESSQKSVKASPHPSEFLM